MRVDDDPSTKSACGESICSDAPICLSSFSEKEVPLKENVQRHKCNEAIHYLLREDKGSAWTRNGTALPNAGDWSKKEKARPKNIKISDDKRKEESIRNEQRSRQEKEYEDEFLEDLNMAFLSHTTGSLDSAPAPPQHYSQRLEKRQKRTG